MQITMLPHKFKRDRKAVSNIIVLVLSLILIVVIVANVVLWSYQMNQYDWNRNRESIQLLNATRIDSSAWVTTSTEYSINMGHWLVGSYTQTQTIDGNFESFAEENTGAPTFEYGYVFTTSSERFETISGTPVDDPYASVTINLEKNSYVLIIYNAGNGHGSTESIYGKGCAINVDGQDKAFSWQSPYASNYANSVTVIWAGNLTAGTHTIKGRVFAIDDGSLIGIDTRQLAVFWFPSLVEARFIRSTVKVTTTSSSPVDDVEAVINLNLTEDSVALIIYNVGNQHSSREYLRGKGITLNIDGSDIATSQWQSPYASNYANSVTIAQLIQLSAGSHTIKGRFFSNRNGRRVTIDERQLAVLCFPVSAVEYEFRQSTVEKSTTSGSPVDDSEAILTPNLGNNSDCLAIYIAGNPYGATENARGKGITLNIDGNDKTNSTCWQSPYSSNHANSVFSVWCGELSAGSHTIKGRFFSNRNGRRVTISHRQILLLAFPDPKLYRLELAGKFIVDLDKYPMDQIQGIEILMVFRTNTTEETWFIKAYNWTGAYYGDNGFNVSGAAPSTSWTYYAIDMGGAWRSYIHDNGTIMLQILDEGMEGTATSIEVDFLGIRLIIRGIRLTMKNNGALTVHIISIWINNSTIHQRYNTDIFIAPGETEDYIMYVNLQPSGTYLVKVVTERGNIAIRQLT